MPSPLRPRGEVAAVDGVPVPHQVPRPAAPGGGLDQLPPDPRRRRMRGDGDVDELAPRVRDEEQHVQRPERQGLDGEQVGGPDAGGVVPQEGAPGLARRPRRAAPAVAADGAVAHGEPQLEELAADPLGAPERVVPGHARRSARAPPGSAGAAPGGSAERQRQKRRHARRCQRTTVSGRTRTRCRRQSRRRRRASTQSSLSRVRSRGRRRVGRVSTASWWRSSRFSASRSLRSRRAARSTASRSVRHSNTASGCRFLIATRCQLPSGLLPSYSMQAMAWLRRPTAANSVVRRKAMGEHGAVRELKTEPRSRSSIGPATLPKESGGSTRRSTCPFATSCSARRASAGQRR